LNGQVEGGPAADFVVAQPMKGSVHLFGIESPGLTSSLELAEFVADKMGA
jgi:L-2-hydroxyglutarate oxidase LhgO